MIKTNVLIIGGGSVGLLTAFYLHKLGENDIIVVEKSYPGSGGTYRCATGVRASFTSMEHIILMKRSIELWKELSNELGIKYSRSGYIWLLNNEKQLQDFKKYVAFQNRLGVPTRIISPSEVRDFVPSINYNEILAGVHDPLAGKADCFDTVINVLKYLRKNSIKIINNTKVEKIIVKNGRVCGVKTNRGDIEANNVVISAGYGSRDIVKSIGINLPLENLPRHALVTERFKKLFDPLLIDWSTGSYIVQTFAGNFLIGCDIPEKPDGLLSTRVDFLFKAAEVWTRYFNWLREVNILRYWTGYYVMTPDHHPILGPISEIEGLYIATGFSGHGFMMAPVTGELMANWIIYGKPSISIANNLTYERFKLGKMIRELAVFG